jgi:hypothetical protein
MQPVIYKPLLSTETSLVAELTSMLQYLEIGGSTVDQYKVEYRHVDAAEWTEILDSGLQTSLTGLIIGLNYEIRCAAHNIHGWSTFSDSLIVT